ncbi:SUMF1/EgtB/PvdO family nonheme iron enzyme [Isoptericola halotolerans]
MLAGPPSMLSVPAGTIDLRDARTGSVREVGLQPFSIGATPVTRRQWELVGPSSARERPTVPVRPVSWFDAVSWCNAASTTAGLRTAYTIEGRAVTWDTTADGFRLPTEAEWEHAARAGSTAPTYGPLAAVAWTALDEVDGVQPVARKEPNAFGVYDMLGNVWEWCWDYADPARYADYRVLRGGGWADRHWSVRASVRRGSLPEARLEDVGFRVARGAVGQVGSAQGWSARRDRERADVRGPVPFGWTPLRELLEDGAR